jgi:hypothetical protein
VKIELRDLAGDGDRVRPEVHSADDALAFEKETVPVTFICCPFSQWLQRNVAPKKFTLPARSPYAANCGLFAIPAGGAIRLPLPPDITA